MAVSPGGLVGLVVGFGVRVVRAAVGMEAGMAVGVGLDVGSAPVQATSSKTLNTETVIQIAHARIGQIIG